MKPKTKKIQTGLLYREFPIEVRQIDEEARTVDVTFSTEYRVERFFGGEILDHNPASVRMDRLKDRAAVLVNHDRNQQVGVVESASIDSAARIGRAVVRFGKSAKAEEVFRDVVDGIRTKVSAGYRIFKAVLEDIKDDVETIRATDWEPYEISVVAVPADPQAVINRQDQEGRPGEGGITFETIIEDTREMEPENDEKKKAAPSQPTGTAPAPAPKEVNVREIEDQARERELKRIRELTSIGDSFVDFGGRELAKEHIDGGKSVAELNSAILQRIGKREVPDAGIGMETKDVNRYSFVRVLNALANPKSSKLQDAAGYEMELSRAAADKMGKEPNGILVPAEVLREPLSREHTLAEGRRDLLVSSGGGGYTVDTNILGMSFIELLRNREILLAAGATELNDLIGNISIPRHSAGATAYWVAEGDAPTESTQTIDQVNMSPHTVGAFTDFGRQLLNQSSIDVEAFVRNDLARTLALEKDRVGLYGTGGSQPLGLANTTGIGAESIGGPTFAEMVALETDVATANADVGQLAYLVNPAQRGTLKTTTKAGTFPVFIWENDQVNGYRAMASNQIVSGDYWFGNWGDLVIANWAGLDLMVDPYSQSTNRLVRIIAFQDTDVGVRHPGSFSLGQ